MTKSAAAAAAFGSCVVKKQPSWRPFFNERITLEEFGARLARSKCDVGSYQLVYSFSLLRSALERPCANWRSASAQTMNRIVVPSDVIPAIASASRASFRFFRLPGLIPAIPCTVPRQAGYIRERSDRTQYAHPAGRRLENAALLSDGYTWRWSRPSNRILPFSAGKQS